MLFKINDALVNLDEVKYFTIDDCYIEDFGPDMYVLRCVSKSSNVEEAEYLMQAFTKEELVEIWEELKTYKCMFYEITPDILINLKNISSIQNTELGLKITFTDEKISDNNLVIYSYQEESPENIDKVLEEIRKLS